MDAAQYLLTCTRYVELNPVRANNMVGYRSEYPWCRFRFNALGQEDLLISPRREYRKLGRTDIVRQAYRQLFRARIVGNTLMAIRESTNKARVLGGRRFKHRIARQTDRPVSSSGHGGDRKSELYQKSISLMP